MDVTPAAQEESGISLHVRSAARFVGQYKNKIDAKGRVSVPADLRRFVDLKAAAPSEVLYCFPSLFADELQCGGPDLVQIILSTLSGTDVLGGDHYAHQALVTADMRRLYFDENGRVVVPKELRTHAKLQGEVSFQGRGAFFVMGAPADLNALRDAARNMTQEQRDAIRARSTPGYLDSGEEG